MDLLNFYNNAKYLILFGREKYGFIYNRVRYLIDAKSGITYVISQNYVKRKAD